LKAVSQAQVLKPAEMIALGESRFLNGVVNEIRDGTDEIFPCRVDTVMFAEFRFDSARHGKLYNQVFCDGHMSSMNPWVLFNPTNTAAIWNYDHQPHQEQWIPE